MINYTMVIMTAIICVTLVIMAWIGRKKQEGRRMNKVDLTGRLTKDPQSRWTNGQESQEQICIVRFTLAVNRRKKDAGADFISCVAFGKSAESLEKYCKKGTKLEISGRIQTGSYTNKDGGKVYTTDVIVEEWEFAESKAAAGQQGNQQAPAQPETDANGFMNIPEGIDEELPFS